MTPIYQNTTAAFNLGVPGCPPPAWTYELILKGNCATRTFAAGDSGEVRLSASRATCGDTGEVGIVRRCELAVLPDPAGDCCGKTQSQLDLEAVDEAIRALVAGGAVQSYSIQTTVGQRQLTRMSLDELRKHRRWLVSRVNKERAAMGLKPLGNDRWLPIKSCLGGHRRHVRRRRR